MVTVRKTVLGGRVNLPTRPELIAWRKPVLCLGDGPTRGDARASGLGPSSSNSVMPASGPRDSPSSGECRVTFPGAVPNTWSVPMRTPRSARVCGTGVCAVPEVDQPR